MKKEKLMKLKELAIYFFLFAFIGWIGEELYAFYVHGTFVKRGFLYGPMCPMYGFGAILLIIINNLIAKRTKSNVVKFVLISAICTVFEYLVSVIFEFIFGIRWWDYTNELLNFKGRICLMFSIIWGIAGIVFINWIYIPIKKMIEKVEEKISPYILNISLIILVGLTILDVVLSSIKYLR